MRLLAYGKSEWLQAYCLARVPQWSKRCVPQTGNKQEGLQGNVRDRRRDAAFGIETSAH